MYSSAATGVGGRDCKVRNVFAHYYHCYQKVGMGGVVRSISWGWEPSLAQLYWN